MKLCAAWHLAVGSQQTAEDLSLRMKNENATISDELRLLAENFQQIASLLESCGVKTNAVKEERS